MKEICKMREFCVFLKSPVGLPCEMPVFPLDIHSAVIVPQVLPLPYD